MVFIVRHGETDWNKQRKFQGQTDVPLNHDGRMQAEKLAGKIKEYMPFDLVVASDLNRAIETAEIMTAGYGTPILTDKAFREMDFGEWEGLDMKTIEERWPGKLNDWFSNGILNVSGGETQEQFFERVWKGFRYWADKQDYKKMAIVCHGGTSGALICKVMDREINEMSKYMLKNTGVSIIGVEAPGNYNLHEMGELLR
jgi:broad specificity phosphatase PhoE